MTESTNTPNPTNPSQPTTTPTTPAPVPAMDSTTAAKTDKEWIDFFANEIWSLHLPDPNDDTSDYRDHEIYVTTAHLAKRARLDEALVLILLYRHHSKSSQFDKVDILLTNSPIDTNTLHNADESSPYPHPQAAWLDKAERRKRIKAAKAADAANTQPSESDS